jgi:GT2 family glycosyltransferase
MSALANAETTSRMEEPIVDPSRTSKLAVAIVTYNSADVLPGLLDSLGPGLVGVDSHEVIVIDNDSRDSSADIAEAHPIGARVVRTGRNGGYAAGINAAAAVLDDDTDILVLNPDVRLKPGCGQALSRLASKASVGIVVPQILNEDETVARFLRREPSIVTSWSDALLGTKLAAQLGLGEIVADETIYRRGGHVEWATGAALCISAQARRKVGDWDETFFLYSEEVDYMERVRSSGLEVLYTVDARAVHIGGEYHENTYLSALMTANRIRYYSRHHGSLPTLIFRLGIVVGETMRAVLGPGHRAALGAAIRPGKLVRPHFDAGTC